MGEAIIVSNVSKKFDLVHERNFNLIKKKEAFFPLKNITLKIKKGECLGIIGRNGSGKTTLLRLLAGILQPTSGTIKVEGKTLSLLDLGFGFQEELTGKDNIFLYGSLLGIDNRIIRENLENIIEFSGLGKFIDVNVQDYSNGMRLRLAFSIAMINLPDIILIDEIIAVGDSEFQKKSHSSIKEMADSGKTVVIVSHDLESLRNICDRVILLNEGRIIEEGSPKKVILSYLALSNVFDYDQRFKELLNRVNRYNQIEKDLYLLKKSKHGGVIEKIFALPLELRIIKKNKLKKTLEISIISLSKFLSETYSQHLFYLWEAYEKENSTKLKKECMALIEKIKKIYRIKEKFEETKDLKQLLLQKNIDSMCLYLENGPNKSRSIKELIQDYENLIMSGLNDVKSAELFHELKNIVFSGDLTNMDLDSFKYMANKYEELGAKRKIKPAHEIKEEINTYLKSYYAYLETNISSIRLEIDEAKENNLVKKQRMLEKKRDQLLYLKNKAVTEFRDNAQESSQTKRVNIINLDFLDVNDLKQKEFYTGETLKLKINYFAEKVILNPVFGIAIFKEDGTHLSGPNTKFSNTIIKEIKGKGDVTFVIEDLPFLEGIYLVSCTVHPYNSFKPYDYHDKKYIFHVKSKDIKDLGIIHLKGKWELKQEKG